jgi:hypothetical protein
MRKFLVRLLPPIFLLTFTMAVQAATPEETIAPIQNRWAEIKYRQPEKEQAEAYHALALQARKIVESNPGMAEALIWEGAGQGSTTTA